MPITANKYFVYPFATSGTLTPIPDGTQSSGRISYQQGWGPYYTLNLALGGNALPMDENQTNQLFNDITQALQQYQQWGIPNYITASQNLSTPFPYSKNAYALYDAMDGNGPQQYQSLADSNTNLPTDASTWQKITSSSYLPVGTIIDFSGTTAPPGFLNCDGTAYSRATYSDLFQTITFSQSATLSSSINITGLTSTTNMYVGMAIEGTGIPSSTTVASIVSSSAITISNAATLSGTETLTFFSWGNGDGSTTFNVPDFRRRTAVGSGGSGTSVLGNVVGNTGGEESHTQTISEMPAHTHYLGVDTFGHVNDTEVAINFSSGITSIQTSPTGDGDAFNIMQPSAIVLKIIKY